MKEIDFLPSEYGEQRYQEGRVKKQYVVLSIMFLVMIVWNASAKRSMNMATAAMSMAEEQRIRAERVFMASDHLTQRADRLASLVRSLGRLKDNLNPAVILAELSVQIPERVVLRRLELAAAEPFQRSTSHQNKAIQIVLAGLGADAEDVGKLIERLEDSDYFSDISMTHSQKALDVEHTIDRSRIEGIWPAGAVEFELTCYLATRPSGVLMMQEQ